MAIEHDALDQVLTISCDDCENEDEYEAPTFQSGVEMAKDEGWHFSPN